MELYTERHGMRKPVEKTFIINRDMYALLFDCCQNYHDYIAWKHPQQCSDGCGCCGLDWENFNMTLRFEIPCLYGVTNGSIRKPTDYFSEYDQYALLDYIEYIAWNCRDVVTGDYHSFYRHHHLICQQTDGIFKDFQKDVNHLFSLCGLLYKLVDDKRIERTVEYSPLTSEIENLIATIPEEGAKKLLKDAVVLYKTPNPTARSDSVEKIWDAFERLKTYYSSDKKKSSERIISDMAGEQDKFKELFNAEFAALSKIGNEFRIRHHERGKIDIDKDEYYDYFFNRCLSLIALAIQHLQ